MSNVIDNLLNQVKQKQKKEIEVKNNDKVVEKKKVAVVKNNNESKNNSFNLNIDLEKEKKDKKIIKSFTIKESTFKELKKISKEYKISLSELVEKCICASLNIKEDK